MDFNDLASPSHLLNPINPASPLWFGHEYEPSKLGSGSGILGAALIVAGAIIAVIGIYLAIDYFSQAKTRHKKRK